MFQIKLTAKARRELKNITKFDKLRIAEILQDLKNDPFLGKPLTRELVRRYSYRTGVYRIIYKINRQDRIVEILTAGHRSTIYN